MNADPSRGGRVEEEVRTEEWGPWRGRGTGRELQDARRVRDQETNGRGREEGRVTYFFALRFTSCVTVPHTPRARSRSEDTRLTRDLNNYTRNHSRIYFILTYLHDRGSPPDWRGAEGGEGDEGRRNDAWREMAHIGARFFSRFLLDIHVAVPRIAITRGEGGTGGRGRDR